MHPRRGEVYWIDWSPSRGSEQAGKRPGLVISGDAFNRMFPVCTVLAVTTNLRPSQITVPIPAGLTPDESRILPWQVMTVAQDRLGARICTITQQIQATVDERLRLVWGL